MSVKFVAKVSKSGNRYIITIPKKVMPSVERGKKYLVTLEGPVE